MKLETTVRPIESVLMLIIVGIVYFLKIPEGWVVLVFSMFLVGVFVTTAIFTMSLIELIRWIKKKRG